MSGSDKIDDLRMTDEVLFSRYSNSGDNRAFDEILKRNKGLIFSLILRFVKSRAEAEEVFQEVFFKVCKNKDQFRRSVSFKSWLVTICRHTCIDYVRKQGRSLKLESIDHEDDRHRPYTEVLSSEEEETPFDVTLAAMENERLKELLDELPESQKMTFYLKVIMEFTFEEIGTSMGCSTNTAKSRYRYALEGLRAVIKRRQLMKKAVSL